MSDSRSLMMIQFLDWVGDRPRTYRQAMEAWRTSCPRLSVWEDAIIEGLVCIESGADRAVCLTSAGRAALQEARAEERAHAD
jgi:hypothetical protein